MPVQINEVIIRAVVDPKPIDGNASQLDCPLGNSDQDAELMEKIFEIIKEKQER